MALPRCTRRLCPRPRLDRHDFVELVYANRGWGAEVDVQQPAQGHDTWMARSVYQLLAERFPLALVEIARIDPFSREYFGHFNTAPHYAWLRSGTDGLCLLVGAERLFGIELML